MEKKEGKHSGCLPGHDYSFEGHNYQQELIMKPHINEAKNNDPMVNYMLINNSSDSFDKLSFADAMQFADFSPDLGLSDKDKYLDDHDHDPVSKTRALGENLGKCPVADAYNKSKRKRPRSRKTSEQVESQRMTHIVVERNRRKQLNEHLCILRSLMPSSYVQRGDQASIIGGAIEFVRELEQLVQCLESQKRRRVYGDSPTGDHPTPIVEAPSMLVIPNDQMKLVGDYENGLSEEKAEIKSCLADIEVELLRVDGSIKILSRNRPGQLIKIIAALEDLQLNIVHTNVTTIEQTVLYSFNFKMNGEALRFTAEDIANSTHQILSNFINAQ